MLLNNYSFLDIMDKKKEHIQENKRIEKIYSRKKVKLPIIQFLSFENKDCKEKIYNDDEQVYKIRKVIKIITILMIAFLIAKIMIDAITPIIDSQCVIMAKTIATKISNEQATKVMSDYHYEDLTNVTKDENGNIKMISANIITVNRIISDIPILMQEELNKQENSKFNIKLGSFIGSKMFSGRGPNVEIIMSVNGNIETDLRSEFSAAGINQTLHRIYLEVRCNVIILTPFNTIEERIINQVLLAEGVIIGEIPNTYYNLEGITQEQSLEVID